jgi:hypothetical protein
MAINVFPNCTLNIVNSHFSACTDLWAGINIISNSNGTGIVNILANSFIEDAQNAVSSNRTDNFRLRTSVFNRNVNSVKVNSATGFNNDMIIIGCVFTCRSIAWPLIPSTFSTNTVRAGIATPPVASAYPTAICKAPYTFRSARGIFLTDVTFAYLGTDVSGSNASAGNLFDFLDFGIDLVQADLKVRKQTFQRMSNPKSFNRFFVLVR